MSLSFRAAETVIVILSGLVLGWLARRRGLSESVSPQITRLTLTFAEPIPIALSLWGLSTSEPGAFLLPVLDVVMIALMWPVGHVTGRMLGLRGGGLGAFATSAMFSNVGITYGAFLAYALLGERGAALGYLYCATFMPTFFTLGFWVGGRYGEGERAALQVLSDTLSQPQSRNPILGTVCGLLLLVSGLPRPSLAAPVVSVLVPAITFSYMFAIGLSMHVRAMLGYWRPALVMHGLKFVVAPALGLALGHLVGLSSMGQDLMPVLFLEVATPTAIMALVLAQARSLDVQLANACWLATNLTSIALAPLWLYIASIV